MFYNYFKTAFRNLLRNKGYALINIVGLAVGIAACLLIFLVIQFETSFDNFHEKKKDIYRIGSEFHSDAGISYSKSVSFPVGPQIRIDYPQIKQVASIFNQGGQITIEQSDKPPKKFDEDYFFYAEPQFFKIFDFPFLAGSPETSLKEPNDAVLTQAYAEKYFGDWRSAIGKSIKYQNKTFYKITGILKNMPLNTDFPLNILVPYSAIQNTYLKDNLTDWVSTFGSACTFVVLPKDLSPGKFNKSLKLFAKKYRPEPYALDAPIAQPLQEIHFDERFGTFGGHTFGHPLINVLGLIGIFLIVIASVNFINLATAQAVNRSKEVGIRKVLGSMRLQLAAQFLGETFLITLCAVCAAIGIAAAALPMLNRLLELKLSFSLLSNPMLIFFLAASAVIVTFLSGIYPAVILSGFNPITALKSKVTARMVGGLSLRRTLVVLQFVIAQVLIIGMQIVVKQMDFFRHASLGFDKAAILNVPLPEDSISHSRINYVHDKLLKNPDIQNKSFSFATPSSETMGWNSDFIFDHASKQANFSADLKWADAEYFKTFNLQFVAGRPYYPSDTVREFVVNETLLHKMGIGDPKSAIGKQINFWHGNKVANIVGVIRDFNSHSLKRPLDPVLMSSWKDVYQTINIKIRPGAEKTALPYIEKVWDEAFPDYLYHYKFLDDAIADFYRQEAQLSTSYKVFAAIAIFISCLGLYGLVSFMAVQRTKEVGIRKVLGASAQQIVYLFSREFTILIVIAFGIAAPIAYFILHQWLMGYAYRIDLSASIFILAIGGSVMIAWVTVGHRAIRAAIANPVKSLRTE